MCLFDRRGYFTYVVSKRVFFPEIIARGSDWPLGPHFQRLNALRSTLIGLVLAGKCVKLTRELTLRSTLIGLVLAEEYVKLTKESTQSSSLVVLAGKCVKLN